MASVTADSINYKVTLLKQISRLLSDGQALAAAETTLTQCLELAPEARDVAEQFVAARLSQCKWPMTPENGKFTRRGLVSRLHPLSVCAYTDDPLFQLAASDKYAAPCRRSRIAPRVSIAAARRSRSTASSASDMSVPTFAITRSAI